MILIFWTCPVTAVKGQLTTLENLCDSMARQLAGGNRYHWCCHGLVTHVGRHPLNATEIQVRNIPLEPARAVAQDSSLIDYTTTDWGTEMTMIKKNTAHEKSTTAAGHTLKVCSCGWESLTMARGLRIHQGRKKSLREQRQETRIDQYFLQSNQSSQSNETQQRNPNQSLHSISTPVFEEDGTCTDLPVDWLTQQPNNDKSWNNRLAQQRKSLKGWETLSTVMEKSALG